MAAPLAAIGVVRTAHAELSTTPIQAGLNRAEHGIIEIAERYREGLDGLADESHFVASIIATVLPAPIAARTGPHNFQLTLVSGGRV